VVIILLFILLYLSPQHSCTCKLKEIEFVKAINSLYSKGVFDSDGKSLNLAFDKSIVETYSLDLNKISLEVKKIKKLKNNSKTPWLNFTAAILSEESPGRQTLKFKAREGGTLYSGDIVFDCVNDQLVYTSTFIISSID
jgi:hypothetical protein